MNPKNEEGVYMWRDDEVTAYLDGTKQVYERYFIKTQCWKHSDADMKGQVSIPKNPAYVILEADPYKGSIHLSCIEAREIMNPEKTIFCENENCPLFDIDVVMNETEYLKPKDLNISNP
jgi:hypothetical protein